MNQNQGLVAELESLVREGKFPAAQQILKRLDPKSISRSLAGPIANIARRIEMHSVALVLLNPIVRADSHVQEPATPFEKIEYAATLRRVGAVEESMRILESIDTGKFPEALLYQAMGCFSQWRYEEAIPLLENYIRSDRLSPYLRLVGKVNLAAALVRERKSAKATELLDEIQAEALENGHRLLYGNSLELKAQLEIQCRNWDKAKSTLRKAGDLLADSGSTANLWISKWTAIAESSRYNRVSDSLLAMVERAERAGHWETVRDSKFHIARISRDPGLMAYAYFGTPFGRYRKSMLEQTGEWFEPPESFIWGGAQSHQTKFNILSSRSESGDFNIPFGQVCHRLLLVLCSDFFKPVTVVGLFAQLFPAEHFNPHSSPTRVYQGIRRLRGWVKEAGLELAVAESGGMYRLVPSQRVGLEIPRDLGSLDSCEIQLKFMLGRLAQKDSFGINEAQAALSGSRRSAQRLLKWAVNQKKIEVFGAGPARRYHAA